MTPRGPGMARLIALAAGAAGLAVIAWVALASAGQQPVALATTLLIAAAYLAGGLELHRYAADSAALQQALRPPVDPPDLGPWLARVPTALQPAVRGRIEGERLPLPGPVLTPFLVGLLVLLGMLGTFIGMVLTLKGAVGALDASADLAAIRAALTEPVRGLGVAFGTSVAGVAGSAMLGLASALLRRERIQLGQALDAAVAASLHRFSQAHQRAQAREQHRLRRDQQAEALASAVQYQADALASAMQRQAEAWPLLLGQLQATADRLAEQHGALTERLTQAQAAFHAEAAASTRALAQSIDHALQASLVDASRAAAAAIQPAVAATMAGLAEQGARVQQGLGAAVQAELQGLSARFDATVQQVSATWDEALAAQRQAQAAQAAGLDTAITGLLARVELHQRGLAEAAAQADATRRAEAAAADAARREEAAAADAARLAAWQAAMEGIARALQSAWQQAGEQSLARQQEVAQAICHTLADTARGLQTEAEAQSRRTQEQLVRLIDAAAEAPRSATELVGQLRTQLAEGLVRDNAMLDERARLVASLGELLDTLRAAAQEQRGAIDALVATSAGALQQVGTQFAQAVESGSQRLADSALALSGSAIEVASLGEAFGAAVAQFGSASEAIGGQLARIEAALDHAARRSDEQLGYYVAQAREIVELSIGSQRQIVDDLRRIAERPLAATA